MRGLKIDLKHEVNNTVAWRELVAKREAAAAAEEEARTREEVHARRHACQAAGRVCMRSVLSIHSACPRTRKTKMSKSS